MKPAVQLQVPGGVSGEIERDRAQQRRLEAVLGRCPECWHQCTALVLDLRCRAER